MSEDTTSQSNGFSTRAIRAASTAPVMRQRPNAVPIYQSATFSAEDAGELGDILGDRVPGYAYARIDHPTGAAMASAIAELEGAEAGHPFASGMAAIHAALLASLSAGDHVVATRAIYGSTQALLQRVLARFGIDATFVDPTDLDAVAAAFRVRTRVLYLETISNPTIVVADLERLIGIAHERRVRVIVDNTFASPYLCRPAELGADLVVESCTKWLGGHSDVIAGVVTGGSAAVEQVRRIAVDTGGNIEPFSAFLVLRGIMTLAVRMERHCASALAVARFLETQPGVDRLYYPGLPSHPQYQVAQTRLRAGGGMLAFDLGSRDAAARAIDALRLPPRTASLGSVHTMAVHPPSHTHRQLDDAALAAAGIPPGLVRVSVGLEDVEDLIADFGAALAASGSAVHA
ncbi:MAG: aminotransferase class I/II-fold pyridoxal phosphate-dependent enzyme [Chloroflexi bacterium]|nr:aminotransferase class I/II-fold pyridoxal phosphate-dependent enzyme [Chloroflexota bacterium]